MLSLLDPYEFRMLRIAELREVATFSKPALGDAPQALEVWGYTWNLAWNEQNERLMLAVAGGLHYAIFCITADGGLQFHAGHGRLPLGISQAACNLLQLAYDHARATAVDLSLHPGHATPHLPHHSTP